MTFERLNNSSVLRIHFFPTVILLANATSYYAAGCRSRKNDGLQRHRKGHPSSCVANSVLSFEKPQTHVSCRFYSLKSERFQKNVFNSEKASVVFLSEYGHCELQSPACCKNNCSHFTVFLRYKGFYKFHQTC